VKRVHTQGDAGFRLDRAQTFGLAIVILLALLLLPVSGAAAALPSAGLDFLFFLAANAGWVEVGTGSASSGGVSNNSSYSKEPSIAVAPDGTPYVAWCDGLYPWEYEIYVRRWNGSAWEEVGAGSAGGGGISESVRRAESPAVAVAPSGTVYVAWLDYTDQWLEIYVRRWNGSSWEEVGTGSASGGGISNTYSSVKEPSIAVALDGTPYVAWEQDLWAIYVRRWNGSAWEEVGAGSARGDGISDNINNSRSPSVAIAPDGTPYVAWHDDSDGDNEIYVRGWTGSAWEEVGTGSATGGGISDNAGASEHPSVSVAPDGTPYVAWHDDSSGDAEIYVRRWNGSTWEEVGAGSASGGGISNDGGASEYPAMAMGPGGRPYVAWHDDSYEEIYVRRWQGSSWEEVGAGSASGGGISDNPGGSNAPAVAVAPDGTPYVAWYDSGGLAWNYEIYVRGRSVLRVSPADLTFLAEEGGADPAPRSIGVDSSLHSVTCTATISPTVGWLSVSPAYGTTPSTITATVSISGLGVNQYAAQIVVAGGGGVDPQAVDVKLVVAEEIYEVFLPLIFSDY
jgi:hypothetical protein